jgi:capsid protein
MGVINLISKVGEAWRGFSESNETRVTRTPTAEHASGTFTPLFSQSFTGEKNLGEIGPIKNYRPHYEILRIRSWQAYYESEIAHTIINRYETWMIGKGLKLQCEPSKNILAGEGIKFDSQEFSKVVESRYHAWKKSKQSDYSGMQNCYKLSSAAFKNAKLGGDVLVILRYINDCVKVQLIDASHVVSPQYGTEYYPQVLANGNTILNGIEFSPNGQHVAYWIQDFFLNFTRIEAIGKNTALQTAFLVYGSRYRLDNVRGVPALSTVLETLKKLERYKEATVGSAEERQKIVMFIKHGVASTGENPIVAGAAAKAFDYGRTTNLIPSDVNGTQLANTIGVSTNKNVYNMPNDSELKSLESKAELHFGEFYKTNIEIVSAGLEMPPNVAMSLYTESFSSSRAALKDWEHTLEVRRDDFSHEFEQNIFNFWLHIEILKGKVSAPGYLKAFADGNYMVLEAYRSARFVGAAVPHIDPLKEVAAERLKLGILGDAIPLTTVEAATERLNLGESHSNIEQFAQERDKCETLGIEAPEVTPAIKEPKD